MNSSMDLGVGINTLYSCCVSDSLAEKKKVKNEFLEETNFLPVSHLPLFDVRIKR